ncbi:MAG: His-Xaa-Ser system radical SAM maturase HxsB [Ferrovum myxofaciens]|uniref:His-Xaa-Ser system radical SAM maturase HxsB n=1 Tax=Ferrovum myxofaciens TaxID=416213 RepID=UPI0023523062|nr:His-Xaa-Ser system radical SAM maturase HxsB [Ferrovum myxofaciens]QKE39978.1 MAG: His-Xaa-Ser system radical SAM maturase HxsB [Ferrovum myxofaciens]
MSKFQNFEAYQPPLQQYKLLPFKFDRLNDEEYLITNMVGEYHIVLRDVLASIVGRCLPPDHPDYPNLRAKHFIQEDGEIAPAELLALKLRTKLARLANFTNLHLFVVTLRCDHSCPYCQVSRQSSDKSAYDMTQETADRALDFVFKSPSPGIKIEFQGGEPLLNFEMVKYVVLRTKERNAHFGKDLQFVIATTMSLLTDEILVFCKKHKVILSSSLDGPENLHNQNRPRQGKDSHRKFVEGLEKARLVLGYDQVSALMTTTEASLIWVKEIIDEYLRLGFQGIFLRHLSPYGFAIKTRKFMAYDAERWLEFYKEGLDYILALNKAGIRFVEHYAAIILTKMLSSTNPGFVDLMNPSGAGIAAIVFNYDGAVYASDESRMLAEMGDQTFRLGHLAENTYEEIILSDALLDALEDTFTLSVPMCSDCAFEPYCGAEPVYHHAIHKDTVARKPESAFCKRNMAIFKHLIGLMQSDEETKRIFLGWVNRC